MEMGMVPVQPGCMIIRKFVGVFQFITGSSLNEHRVHIGVYMQPMGVYICCVWAVHEVVGMYLVNRILTQLIDQGQCEVVTGLNADGGARVAAYVIHTITTCSEGYLCVGMSVLANFEREAPGLEGRGSLR